MRDLFDEGAKQRAACQILRHLAAHPNAKDTPEGIRRFWCPAAAERLSAAELDDVLQTLVSEDWLVRRDTAGSPPVYGANPGRLPQLIVMFARARKES